MDNETRKRLTEYIGECWPEYDNPSQQVYVGTICIDKSLIKRRTFTIPADLHTVYSKIVETGEWNSFISFAMSYGADISSDIGSFYYDTDSFAWLFCLNAPDQIPERMKMVGEFLKERK
jgi:hypothetical protein